MSANIACTLISSLRQLRFVPVMLSLHVFNSPVKAVKNQRGHVRVGQATLPQSLSDF